MVDDRYGVARGRSDLPTAAEEVDLVVGVAAAAKMQGEVEVKEAGLRSGTHDIATLFQGLVPGIIWGEAGGTANGAILTLKLVVEDNWGRVVTGDLLEGQQGEQAVLEGAEATFDFPFCLRARSDQMRNAQGGEGSLELGTRIAPIGRGLIAEEGETVGIERLRTAMLEKGPAEVLEVVPGGVRGYEGGAEVSAGMVVHGEEKGLLGFGLPPGVDGGVVLPEFADGGEVKPALAGGDVGDVGDPDLVGGSCRSGGGQAIQSDRAGMPTLGGPRSITARLPAAQALEAHQASHPVTAVPAPLGAQRSDDSGTAVGPAAALMHAGDLAGQIAILPGTRPRRGLALGPVIVAADRDLEHLAKLFDGMVVLHGRNPDEAVGGGSERMPKVFSRMSRCSLR